jgi:glutamate synthase (NADPH/NADH) small chain
LTAAAQLAGKGYRVTVFESSDEPGGALRYGIPAFRLPRKVLDDEISELRTAGVEIKTNCYVGRTIPLEDLLGLGPPAGGRACLPDGRQGFGAILLATGGGIPQLSNIPGMNLGGVYYAEEFLMRINLEGENFIHRQRHSFPLGAKIAVIGCGNTALDCARLAVRLGPAPGGASREVTLLPPQPLNDKRAFQQECSYGREEGISFESPVKPLEILGDERLFVSGVKCARLDYADLHAEGRWELTPVPDSEYVLDADTVIMAMGHGPNTLFSRGDLRLNDGGGLWINEESGMTSREGVFACGNVIKGGCVVEAMASGKKAAGDIDRYLTRVLHNQGL